MKKIGIINTNKANIKSIISACNYLGNNCLILKDFKDFKNKFDCLIFPGVGSFSEVMNNLKKNQLDQEIIKYVSTGKPSLFICVGLQVLFTYSSEFGVHKGLNILSGKVKKLKFDYEKPFYKVPFIGWSPIQLKKKDHLFKNIEKNIFYFVHSYYVEPEDQNLITSYNKFGNFKYVSSINYKNIYGFQFHPEKSAKNGLQLLKNFLDKV